MGSGCSKTDDAVTVHVSIDQNRNNGNAINKSSSHSGDDESSNNKSKQSSNPLSAAKARRQAAVSIVGTETDDDDHDSNNAGAKRIGGEYMDDPTNIIPPFSPGATTTAIPSNPHSHASSTNHSRTSSPSARSGFNNSNRHGGSQNLGSPLLQHQQSDNLAHSVGEMPASELPPGSVIRRDNSISMPTHNRHRGSSVSLVLTPDQHMRSLSRHSPPAPALSREGSSCELPAGVLQEEETRKTMEKLNLEGEDGDPTGIGHAIVENQLKQLHELHHNHQQHEKNQSIINNGGDEDDAGRTKDLAVMKSLGDIPLADGGGEMSISISHGLEQDESSDNNNNNENKIGSNKSNHHDSPVLNARREQSLTFSKAGDDPDAVVTGHNSLSIPTHSGRKRGSSVCLIMSPEDHLKSPRCKSPPKPEHGGFDSANPDDDGGHGLYPHVGMAPLELGKRMLEKEMMDE